MSELNCPFRFNERTKAGQVVATCGLIQQLMQVENAQCCEVARDACEACVESTPVPSSFINAVFPSILNNACSKFIEDHADQATAPNDRVACLQQLSETAIVQGPSRNLTRIPTCDVFVHCDDSSPEARRSIESVLAQQRATVIVHLVVGHPGAESLAADYERVWNVRVHRFPDSKDLFSAAHELAPSASSEFIALQHSKAVSLPNRIANAIGELEGTGGDLVGSAILAGGVEIPAKQVTEDYAPVIPWPTMVCRRDMLIDIGGFADRREDPDVEFVFRAKHSNAKIITLPLPSVELREAWAPPRVGQAPQYSPQFGSLRHHGRGYPQSRVECDVVLPIYGQLQYVGPAIQSVLEQEGAEAIVHIVDDASPEDTSELFRYWASHPRVRLYRNTENVGQYASFNNVSEFLETDVVAVQDSDDISLPHRMHISGNLMRLCSADYFAAVMEQFGEGDVAKRLAEKRRLRKSFHPYGSQCLYFAMNPTAFFRVELFRRLGGYTDMGGRSHNRAGLDSEFMIRAWFAGARFAFSSSLVSRHRIHMQAMTRSKETGAGSEKRAYAAAECRRRLALFEQGELDPRAMGALGRYRGVTERVR